MQLAKPNGLTRVVLRLFGMGLAVAATSAAVVALQARAQDGSSTDVPVDPTVSGQVSEPGFREVTIVENGLETRARLQVDSANGELASDSVGQVLLALGFVLDKPDLVYPALETPTPWYGRIFIRRAPGVTLSFDGTLRELKTSAPTVADLLIEQNVKLDEDDRVEPDGKAAVVPNMHVKVVRVETKEESEQESIAFETQTQEDAGRYVGESAVKVAGVEGLKEKKFKVLYENGKEVSRELLKEETVKEPVTKVVIEGTKPKPAPTKPVASGPVVGPYADLIMAAAKQYGQNANELMRVMLCESGGYRWADNGAGNLGLMQFSRGMWSESWNSYRGSDIFSTDQIFAAAQAWSLGMRGRWGC